MDSESQNHIRVGEDDLPILGFLPIWIYYAICHAAFEPARIDKLAMLKALEKHTEEEYIGLVGFFMGYLKTNLHKLFEYHFGTMNAPNYGDLESKLTQALDLLQTNRIEQPEFDIYLQFLKSFTLAVASQPCVRNPISESEEIQLQVKARQILKLLD